MIDAFNKDLPYDQFIQEQIAGGFAACGESGSGLSLGAFIAFGIAGGRLLKSVRAEHLDRFLQWTAILGFTWFCRRSTFRICATRCMRSRKFRLNSSRLIFLRLGVVLLIGAFSFLAAAVGDVAAAWCIGCTLIWCMGAEFRNGKSG